MDKMQEKRDRSLDFLDGCQVASARECTGLIQGMPTDEGETESYADLYPIPEQQPLDPGKTNRQDLRDPIGKNLKSL